MSEDVEIFEVIEQIIEISDDEDCKDVLVLDDDVEVRPHDTAENEFSQDQVLYTERTASCNSCITLEGSASESIIENGGENEIKQENNVNNDHSQSKGNIVTSTNNSVTHVVKSKNSRAGYRQRRGRRKKCSGAVTKENESNKLNNNDTNSNYNSANFMQATCTSSNVNLSTTYDFTKLKWLRPLSNLSSPPSLQMVVIDRGHPDWRIETDKWLMVEKRLLEDLNTEMIRTNDSSIGLFDGAKWQRGIKIIGCHNESAFDYIMKFFIKLDKLWNGAKLDAFPITHINRHVVKAYIPPPTIKSKIIMSLIKLQNPSVYSNDWKIVGERERTYGGGMDIWISVNDQSFMQLSSKSGEIKFGINRIFLNPVS